MSDSSPVKPFVTNCSYSLFVVMDSSIFFLKNIGIFVRFLFLKRHIDGNVLHSLV